MTVYYTVMKPSMVAIGDICRTTGINTFNELIAKNIVFDIEPKVDLMGYRSVATAYASLTTENEKQTRFKQDSSNLMIPTEVMKLEPYIVIKFECQGTSTCKLPKGIPVSCVVYDVCKYYDMLKPGDVEALKIGSYYVQKQSFMNKLLTIDDKSTVVLDGLYVCIETASVEIIITCAFRCLCIKSKSSDNVYETLSVAWQAYTSIYPGKSFTETVTKSLGLDTFAYIYLRDVKLHDLLNSTQFLEKIMKV